MKIRSLHLQAACVLTILSEVSASPRDEYGYISVPLLWVIILSSLLMFISLDYLLQFLSAKFGSTSMLPARIVAQNPAGSAKP